MAPRRNRSRARSVLLGGVGLLLVAAPGFALGLFAGVAWEEPWLLVRHLFGGSSEVAWRAPQERGESVAEAPGAAEALPEVAAPPPRAPAPRVDPNVTRMRPDVLSPGASPARFAVQVGAFAESATAERLAEELRGKGFDVYISPGAKAGEARWRVRVGPLSSREDAENAAARLKAEEKLPTWVLDEDSAA
jgi:cell division septation protein DedD